MNRRKFIGSMGAAALVPTLAVEKKTKDEDAIAVWNRETELVSPRDYAAYRLDGNTRGFASLEKLEAAFEKVMREVKETVVTGDAPAVWSVYNMGHLWELGHAQNHQGRLDESLVRPRLVWAKEAGCKDVSAAFWGDRIL